MTDQVNHPTHYNQPVLPQSRPALRALGFADSQMDNVECVEALKDAYGAFAFHLFCEMTAAVYLWRAGLKGDAEQDYQKARWYFNYANEAEDTWPRAEEDRDRVQAAERLVP